MLRPSIDGTTMTLLALREQYHDYALTIRSICADTARERLRYLDGLFDYLGVPQTAAELFACLTPVTLTEFLLDYATQHGPGTRRAMHIAVRGFLRFVYEEQFMSRDLSVSVPSVRQRSLADLPRALPDSCISALWREEGRDVNAMLPVLATARLPMSTSSIRRSTFMSNWEIYVMPQ